jgi:sulfate permease, SulP family
VFYYNLGGKGYTAQWAVLVLTLLMFMIGPSLINYVPRCVAGCVMATLGVDLIRDAL